MGINILKIWEKTGTYKDIQDCEVGDILILSDGMVLKVENNKKFQLKVQAKVLQRNIKLIDQNKIIMAGTPHRGRSIFDGLIEYLETVPLTGEWTYEHLLQRGAKKVGEVAKKLYE